MIRTNDVNRINDVIQTSRHVGMFRLDDHLYELVEQGRIEADHALAFAQEATPLAQRVGP